MNDRTNPIVISVIVPAYNSETSVAKTIESLLEQTLPAEQLEVILVNDGSTDGTSDACHHYAQSIRNVVAIDKENGGVGSARNVGIEAARGRYIAFLDSDDTLAPETLKAATEFFDEHHDEVDAVSYPMRLYNEDREWSHVRENVLTETGIYDLTKLQYAFALITNVNVVVKNNDLLPRFREDLIIHEDEVFFMTILLKKQKVGFCKQGAYRYQQLPGSAVNTKMHPYYQFEKNIGFWEEFFAAYSADPPLYLQASFLNEINWKIKKDLVFPYHYDETRFHSSILRLGRLMDHVANDVIFVSPRADEYFKHYLLSLKTKPRTTCTINEQGIILSDSKGILLCRNKIDVELIRLRIEGDCIFMRGALKSIAFEYADPPKLYVSANGETPRQIKLQHSALGWNQAHVQTNTFWGFCAEVPFKTCTNISFEIKIGQLSMPVRLRFSERARLNSDNGIMSFIHQNTIVSANEDERSITFTHNASSLIKQKVWIKNTMGVFRSNPKSLLARLGLKLLKKGKDPIWLYYDRVGVGGDNSYHQFIHDFEKNDGITRYYVSSDSDAALDTLFEKRHRRSLIRFRSFKHRLLHLQAERIIASYIETPNWCPFAKKTLSGMSDIIDYDLVYLQHGVLHAHMPWKYSADRLPADCEVISTPYETANLTRSYNFQENQLIPSGMPRYDHINPTPSERRILFAPSWRKELVAELPGLRFEAKPKAFASSVFWYEVKNLLGSKKLTELLEQNDYHFDIKLHPIFEAYTSVFESFSSNRIHIVKSVRESDYRLFITDYSSWTFDFVYLKRAIAYFLPDEDEFKSGINGYRKLDIPLEQGFGPLAHTAEQLIEILQKIMNNDGKPQNPYRKRMDNFFFHYDNHQCDRLYEALIDRFKRRNCP